MASALVTGAGRGIGRALALELAAAGWQVHAGVRRTEDGETLQADAPPGTIAPLVLDVTFPEHIAALDASLPAELDAIVNNAGIVVDGPVETIAPEELRRQFEVNVVGQVAVTQAVLPRLRRSRGRIVFISSVSGRVSTPGTGAYSASKFAIEALADALRIELRPWGIKVIVVQPASTDTDVWRSALERLDTTEASLSAEHRELYGRQFAGMRRATKLIQRQTVPVDHVVETALRALSDRRPRARYPVGARSRIQLAMTAVTPTAIVDATLARLTGIPRRA